ALQHSYTHHLHPCRYIHECSHTLHQKTHTHRHRHIPPHTHTHTHTRTHTRTRALTLITLTQAWRGTSPSENTHTDTHTQTHTHTHTHTLSFTSHLYKEMKHPLCPQRTLFTQTHRHLTFDLALDRESGV